MENDHKDNAMALGINNSPITDPNKEEFGVITLPGVQAAY
jgi:hypothetical protein